ncbi:MAG: hypothetical protein U1E89_07880 [Burkholderiaceae bacterium]
MSMLASFNVMSGCQVPRFGTPTFTASIKPTRLVATGQSYEDWSAGASSLPFGRPAS